MPDDSAEPLMGPYDGEAEPLSEDEIDEWIDNTDPPLLAMRFRATIDALTARVTELEGEVRRVNESARRKLERLRIADELLAAAEHRIEELTAERDKWRMEADEQTAESARRAGALMSANSQVWAAESTVAALSAQVQAYRGALEWIEAECPTYRAMAIRDRCRAALSDKEGK